MGYKILVADEDPYVHMFIQNAIAAECLDYEVVPAYDGNSACSIAYNQNIDLIVMTWEMEGLDGIEALHILRSDTKTADIPVIIITSTGKLEVAFEAGANDFLRKPINNVELLIRIKSMLSMFKLIQGITKQSAELERKSEELIHKNKILNEERRKSDDLLLNILPYEIAEQLKNKGSVDAKHYRRASVLFTDFQGFTKISEALSPQEIIKELGVFFEKFDEIIGNHFIEKIKTIGDAYMCVGGLPLRNKSNPIDTVLAGLEMQYFTEELNKQKRKEGLVEWNLRVGIHTGRVVAGVVGKKKFAYDIWGDTVNTASRMESAGEVGKVNVSGATYKYIKDYFECEYRGKIEAKNKGEIDMYFVHGLKPEYASEDSNIIPNKQFLTILSEY